MKKQYIKSMTCKVCGPMRTTRNRCDCGRELFDSASREGATAKVKRRIAMKNGVICTANTRMKQNRKSEIYGDAIEAISFEKGAI